jgi:hypothetical protein
LYILLDADVEYEWDANKNEANIRKHGIRFADAVTVLEDELAATVLDEVSGEQRFASIGMDASARILVVVYTYRGERIRIISARLATAGERKQYVGG